VHPAVGKRLQRNRSLAILYGNLAEAGCVIKTAGVVPGQMKHSGPARVFDSEEDANEGIAQGQIRPGTSS